MKASIEMIEKTLQDSFIVQRIENKYIHEALNLRKNENILHGFFNTALISLMKK
jgi:hypothetical protein